MVDPLAEYNRKRDFKKTPEPQGKPAPAPEFPIYTIQKHDATRLHYDFRLEVDGVLKSWAVTRVPSLDPKVHRLAIRTEDHPRDYAEFEGIIPKGEYGAGPVIVWDYGVFLNMSWRKGRDVPIEKALEDGHVTVLLQGVKLKGEFALTFWKEEGGKEHWLLHKAGDEHAKPGEEPDWDERSALSGRSLDDILAAKKPREWKSNRAKKD